MTLHFDQLNGALIRSNRVYLDDSKTTVVRVNRDQLEQQVPLGITRLMTIPTYRVPFLFRLSLRSVCWIGSSAHRNKSRVHAFSLFTLFRRRAHLVAKPTVNYKSEVHIFSLVTLPKCHLSLALGSLPVTKVRYTFFLL